VPSFFISAPTHTEFVATFRLGRSSRSELLVLAEDGACKLGKGAFDQVQPGAALGSEGRFEAAGRLLGEPGFRLLGDVCGMIVEDQLDGRAGWVGGIEKLQEFNEFATAMAVFTRAWTWHTVPWTNSSRHRGPPRAHAPARGGPEAGSSTTRADTPSPSPSDRPPTPAKPWPRR
jgi:hypothetical protein